MKFAFTVLVAGFALTACSPQYRNGEVRPTVPETLVSAHAAPAAKVATDKAPAAKDSHEPDS